MGRKFDGQRWLLASGWMTKRQKDNVIVELNRRKLKHRTVKKKNSTTKKIEYWVYYR